MLLTNGIPIKVITSKYKVAQCAQASRADSARFDSLDVCWYHSLLSNFIHAIHMLEATGEMQSQEGGFAYEGTNTSETNARHVNSRNNMGYGYQLRRWVPVSLSTFCKVRALRLTTKKKTLHIYIYRVRFSWRAHYTTPFKVARHDFIPPDVI